MKLLYFMLIIVSANIAALESIPEVTYESQDVSIKGSDFSQHVKISKQTKQSETGKKVNSPNKNYTLSIEELPFDKSVGYSTHVEVVRNSTNEVIEFAFSDHSSGGVQPKWINDKYLYFEVFLGHIGSMVFIYNCDSDRVIVCDSALYDGYLRRQQADEFEKIKKNADH